MEHLLTYTISETLKCFVWTPMKTASSHASWVLSHFDFVTVTENLNTGVIIELTSDNRNFGHSIDLPKNHSELSLICTVRHPYQRVFSLFSRRFLDKNIKPEISEFEEFFHTRIENDIEFTKTTNMFNQRIPEDRKSTRLNSSHVSESRMPSSA